MSSNGSHPDGGMPKRTSDEIRREIDRTRHDMDETLDELYARLHPIHLLNDLLDYASWPRNRRRLKSAAPQGRLRARRIPSDVDQRLHRAGYVARRPDRRVRGRAVGVGQRVWREVRQHPIPAFLVATGAGLYLWQRVRRRSPYLHVGILDIGETDLVVEAYGPSATTSAPQSRPVNSRFTIGASESNACPRDERQSWSRSRSQRSSRPDDGYRNQQDDRAPGRFQRPRAGERSEYDAKRI